MFDIHIKVLIQHGNRLFRAAVRIRRIRFVDRLIVLLQKGIPKHRRNLYLQRLPIQACNHDRVAPGSLAQLVLPGIHAK